MSLQVPGRNKGDCPQVASGDIGTSDAAEVSSKQLPLHRFLSQACLKQNPSSRPLFLNTPRLSDTMQPRLSHFKTAEVFRYMWATSKALRAPGAVTGPLETVAIAKC